MSLHDKTPLVYVAVQGRAAPTSITSRVISLEVDEHVNKATHFVLELEDTSGAIRAGEVMQEGLEIYLRWGYPGEIGPPRGGIIHKIEPSYSNDTVHVEAFGKELALSVGPVRRVFRGRTFRQALDDVARDAGLRVDWRAPDGVRLDGQALKDEHAWSWVLRRTAELGLEVHVEGGAIVVREPAYGDAPVRVLHYDWRNAELIDFSPETNTKKKEGDSAGVVAVFFDPASNTMLSHAAGDPNTTRATLARRRVAAQAAVAQTHREGLAQARAAWREMRGTRREMGSEDYAYTQWRHAVHRAAEAGQPIPPRPENAAANLEVDAGAELVAIETLDEPGAPSAQRAVSGTVAATGAAARAHLRSLAEGQWKNSERARVKARATADGDPFLQRGKVVTILGSRMSSRDVGLWYVKGCTHRIGDGYTTELELSRDGVNGGKKQGSAARGQLNAARTATTTAATAGSSSGAREPEREPVDLRDE